MFTLTIEDLTHLGSSMGTEYTTSDEYHFSSIDAAKRYAEKHYNGSRGKIQWKGKTRLTSGDLGYVMYSIKPLVITK